LRKTFQDFSPFSDFNVSQRVEGPNVSFSAASKISTRSQPRNKRLRETIKINIYVLFNHKSLQCGTHKKTFADSLHTPMSSKMSFFSRKEIKVFDENFPGFSPYNGLQWEPNISRSK